MPTEINIDEDTVIEAHDLAMKKEKNDEWYIGREDLGQFIALPEIWAQAVIFMSYPSPLTKKHPSFGAVKMFIRTKSRNEDEFHAELDHELRLLVGQLVQHKIIKAIDGTVLDEQIETDDMLPSIRKKHIAWFFTPVSLVIQGIFVLSAVALLTIVPELRPSLMHYFWNNAPGLSFLTAFASAWILTLQHELFHVLAARAARLKCSLSFSTRGPFLILEAKVKNLLKAPKSKRITVYLAGMMSDLLVFAVGTYLLWGAIHGGAVWPAWAVGLLRQIILLRLLGVAWQFLFSLKTDVTNIIQDAIGDISLHKKAISYLKEWWFEFRHPIKPELGPIHHHQRRWPVAEAHVKKFAVATVLGWILAIVFYLSVTLRLLIELIRRSGHEIAAGFSGSPWIFLDGVFVIMVLGGLLSFTIRTRKQMN